MTKTTYLRQMVTTATPMQLVVLLFERGEELMREAQQALLGGRFEEGHDALTKAQRIVAELMDAIDMERGGELAQNLRRLYLFVWERLLEANLRKSVQPLQDALIIWQELTALWRRVEKGSGDDKNAP